MEIIPGSPLTVLFTASMQCLHDRFETFKVTFFTTLRPLNKKSHEVLPAPCRVEAFVALIMSVYEINCCKPPFRRIRSSKLYANNTRGIFLCQEFYDRNKIEIKK